MIGPPWNHQNRSRVKLQLGGSVDQEAACDDIESVEGELVLPLAMTYVHKTCGPCDPDYYPGTQANEPLNSNPSGAAGR